MNQSILLLSMMVLCILRFIDMEIIVSVKNKTNEHVHFKRSLEVNGSTVFDYNAIVRSLLTLYQGLNVMVCFEISPIHD